MSTKERVLDILNKSGSKFVSGQEMADELFVTRAAIWKAIKALEKDGHRLEAVTNRGYRLAERIKLLSKDSILQGLNTENYGSLLVYDSVGSTNDMAKEFATKKYGENAVVIASCQTRGRGRRGRSFFSPDNTGIYMSFLIYPDKKTDLVTGLTCKMAVALCRAIKDITGIETLIKWVNDIYYRDKKIAGILTEGITSIEDGELEYIVVGVGLNLYEPYDGFPAELANKAGALLDENTDSEIANRICAALINRFYELIDNSLDTSYIDEYRDRSMLIDKYVKIMNYGKEDTSSHNDYAYVLGIDDDCHLMVRYDDGKECALSTGEVSVVRY